MLACQVCRLSECDTQEACSCCCHKSEIDRILDDVAEDDLEKDGEDRDDTY